MDKIVLTINPFPLIKAGLMTAAERETATERSEGYILKKSRITPLIFKTAV